jgi:hypothetical protein
MNVYSLFMLFIELPFREEFELLYMNFGTRLLNVLKYSKFSFEKRFSLERFFYYYLLKFDVDLMGDALVQIWKYNGCSLNKKVCFFGVTVCCEGIFLMWLWFVISCRFAWDLP